MKVNLELISLVIDDLLQRKQVAATGAIPLRTLKLYWETIRLRTSDLSAGIEELHRQKRIGLEVRRDGLWVRRQARASSHNRGGAAERARAIYRKLIHKLQLDRIHRRPGESYSGMDRRQTAGRVSSAGA